MSDRDARLAALHRHLARAARDPALILTPKAARAAEAVRVMVLDPNADRAAAQAMGWYHQLRHLALRDDDELTVSVWYLQAVSGRQILPYPGSTAWRGVEAILAYGRTGKFDLLVHAIALFRAALEETPAGHPARPRLLTDLGLALMDLFERTGRTEAAAEAVRLSRQALAATPAGHPDHAGYLHNLADGLRLLFERTGHLPTVAEAVQVARLAVAATPVGHPDRASFLNNLGLVLRLQFERTGQLHLLVEATEVARAAAAATPVDDLERAGRLNNLGLALRMLFQRTGRLETIVEAVEVARQAISAPTDHLDLAVFPHNLAIALQELFERTGELDVLLEAVRVGREAVAATPADHPDRAGRLHTLGLALDPLFRRNPSRLDILIEAVQVGREAVAATPADHPDRTRILNGFGLTMRLLYEFTEELDVLAFAVQIGREAVAAAPEDHPDRVVALQNLGPSLQLLYRRDGRLETLLEAVQIGRQVAAATPPDDPEHATALENLGPALQMLFERTRDPAVLDEARRTQREAANNFAGPTIVRIKALRLLSLLAADAGDARDGLACIQAALDLVDELAPASLDRADRAHQLGRLLGLPGEAAAAALAAGRPVLAIELLERSRGILAADSLGLHGDDLARLRRHHPELAGGLERLRERIDTLDRSRPAPAAGVSGRRSLADQRREAHAEWLGLLGDIRARPGFADFFRSPPFTVPAQLDRTGAVVYVTTSPARCDALILTGSPDTVRVVPLNTLTQEAVNEQALRLLAAGRGAGAGGSKPAARQEAQREILAVLEWTWEMIAEPVLTHLGHTATPTGDTAWPRIWWCPVGLVALLPLHAAGQHPPPPGPPARPRTVPDLVVSSYTPTVRALARSRAPHPGDAIPSTLIVPVPDLPGAELPGIVVETAALAALIPGVRTLRHPVRATVLEALPAHRVVHFACHGYADWDQPAASRLILADHATAPLTVADLTALHLDADLAYLSACETSSVTPRLADEFIHITAAFHLAGYRHVIGTLWSVDDRTAADIATDFYRLLTADGTTPPRPEHAARALHYATTRLRDRYPRTPSLWAAHIHTGG